MAFLDDDWLAACRLRLEQMPEWWDATRYLKGRIMLSAGKASIVIANAGDGPEIDRCAADDPADIVVVGSMEQWRPVLSGDLDWARAILPDGEGPAFDGDMVFAMRHARAMQLIFRAISGPAADATVSPSPAPPALTPNGTGRYVDVDGMAIYYEEVGEGLPIICLHAACQDSLMYRHVLSGLSDSYRVIAVDAPAHGKSAPPATGPFGTVTDHAMFHERFIDILGLRRPILLGCSMAGNEVLELAARRPGGYAAVIACEGADHSAAMPEFMLDMLTINGHQIFDGYVRSLTGRRTPPDRVHDVIWQMQRTTPAVMRADIGAYVRFDQRAAMGRILSPVLLIRGDDDWMVSQAQVDSTASRIAGSRIATLSGTGHYPMLENPVEFNALIRAFLIELGLDRAGDAALETGIIS